MPLFPTLLTSLRKLHFPFGLASLPCPPLPLVSSSLPAFLAPSLLSYFTPPLLSLPIVSASHFSPTLLITCLSPFPPCLLTSFLPSLPIILTFCSCPPLPFLTSHPFITFHPFPLHPFSLLTPVLQLLFSLITPSLPPVLPPPPIFSQLCVVICLLALSVWYIIQFLCVLYIIIVGRISTSLYHGWRKHSPFLLALLNICVENEYVCS